MRIKWKIRYWKKKNHRFFLKIEFVWEFVGTNSFVFVSFRHASSGFLA